MTGKQVETERYFGCHVSSQGGLHHALVNGEALKVNTIQVHPSPPQRWNNSAFNSSVTEAFLAEQENSHIVKKVFFHAIYLINLASPNSEQVQRSQQSLIHYLNLNSSINGCGVIVHVGSWKDQPDEGTAFKQAAEAINHLLNRTSAKVPLLLEVAAGSGAIVGDRFEELAEIFQGVEDKERVGFALDTQHMWASGYDIAGQLEEVVVNLESSLGIERIKAIHVNDSKVELASRKDRHENLGEGTIGLPAIKAFLNHKKLAHIPCILETPGLKALDTAAVEVEKLRSILT